MIINFDQSQQEFKYHRENHVWGRQLSILNEMFVFVFGKATVCLAVVCHSHPGGSCQCLVGCRRRRSHWETRCHGLLYHWWQDAIRPSLRRFMQGRACVCPNPGWRFHEDTIRANRRKLFLWDPLLWIMKYEKCTYYILLVECACFANKQTRWWRIILRISRIGIFKITKKSWSFSDSQRQNPCLISGKDLICGWRIVSELPCKFWFAIFGLASCR